jgi:hypothetical protein
MTRRSSSTWLFSAGLLLLSGWPVAAFCERPRFCLPAFYEGGERLHEFPSPNVFWLQLLLRQHEVCWRRPDSKDEVRIFLYGNSAIFGHPLPVRETLAHLLNERFFATHFPAHVFNLGFVATYQLKDAVIIHESQTYEPGLIIYATSLSDFDHYAPTLWPGLAKLFTSNASEMIQFADEKPAGLSALLEIYRGVVLDPRYGAERATRLRQIGALLRTGVRHHAQTIRHRLLPGEAPASLDVERRQTQYDCATTKKDFATRYDGWQAWNALAYLQQIQETTGVQVLIVNWPAAHEPVDDCYNVRYPSAAFAEFNQWLQEQATSRGMHYLDLHELLPAEDFVDSLHVSAPGHRNIADAIQPIIESLVKRILEKRGPPETSARAVEAATP